MRKSVFSSVFGTSLLVLAAACSTTPTGPTTSFTAPSAAGPTNGVSYKFKEQPVTLSILNAVRTDSTAATYSLEVATDTAFANKVFSRDGIAEGAASTSVTLGTLPGNVTYYWRWKSVVDGNTSSPSALQSFTVQQQIVINTPTPSTPASGTTTSEQKPTFVTKNATRQGSVGAITYDFQVSNSSSFGTILASKTGVAEGSGGQTSWTPTTDISAGTIFWRVRAVDNTNSELSGYSSGLTLSIQPFNMKDAIILNNPANMGSWAETAEITYADTAGDRIVVDFDKRDGPGRWPETPFGDGKGGTIQYCLGLCENIGGKWYCSAAIQFWYGRDLAEGGRPPEIGINWFYDTRWGIMDGYQPRDGELVGVFVANGNVRDSMNWATEQRSKVLLMPWGSVYIK